MTVTQAAEPSNEGAEAGLAEPASAPQADPPLISVGHIAARWLVSFASGLRLAI